MRRLIWTILAVLGLSALGWAAGTAYFKDRAFRLYHGGPYHTQKSLQPPRSVAEHARQFEADLQELQRLTPGLAAVDRKYLGQPLDETQRYLYNFGLLALKNKDQKRWQLATRLLLEMWLQEREASQLDIKRVATLCLFQQRLLAWFAQVRLEQRKLKLSLPEIAPKDWAGRTSVAHRLLVNYRIQQFEEWEMWGGLRTWVSACDTLERLDRWHAQLDSGQALSPPTPPLQSLYDALRPLQSGS